VSSINAGIVSDFLAAMAEGDGKRAAGLLDPQVEWRNTGLPTLRGNRAIQMIRSMEDSRISFDVVVHAIAAEGDTVLTDRTDVLAIGPVRTRFWVCGTFKLRDGLIVTWDDHFSFGNFLKGLLAGTLRR
jgi:limonene-1,2-epoxide hydrolase